LRRPGDGGDLVSHFIGRGGDPGKEKEQGIGREGNCFRQKRRGGDGEMKKVAIAGIAILLCLGLAGNVLAENATKAECVAKTKEAAKLINEKGVDAAVAEINKKDGKFVWKDTYVFVVDFDGKVLAHPTLTGKNVIDMKDKSEDPAKAKFLFKEFTKVAKDKGEGWVEYMWTYPGDPKPRKKISYIYRVPGKDMYTAAGIWE
jgi:cytochrome c